MVKNDYPEVPEVPYKKTTVQMPDVVIYLKSLQAPAEVKRAAYIIFRNESQNGQKGINNNYAGVQADSGRWSGLNENEIAGTVVLHENMTDKERRFIAFKDFKGSVDFLIDRVKARGLYVGGKTHLIAAITVKTPEDLARAYKVEWVTGQAHAIPTSMELQNFLSMYKQAEAVFN